MKPDHEPLASQALSALADQCEIPPEVEARILSAVLDGDPPKVVPPPVGHDGAASGPKPRRAVHAQQAPFENVIRLGKTEGRFYRRVSWAAAAASIALLGAVVASRPSGPSRAVSAVALSPAYAPLPSGTRVSEGPRLDEAKAVLVVLADTVDRECKVGSWSADVVFEKTGRATVLGVRTANAVEEVCVRKVVSRARARPEPGPRLAVRFEAGADGTRHIEGWLVDEG